MDNFEKLGIFYLGRPYDLAAGQPREGLLLYDSKDLVTHGVCIGMTGSGKTGLCISLLEEAAMDGIPAIIIDPKGDMSNLLLTFPDLAPEDFRPWINEEDALKKGLTPDQYAAGQAELWTKGLAAWGQSGERIRAMRQKAEFKIYTPGSTAGQPVSILRSFEVPPPAVVNDSEMLQEQVSGTAGSLLGLVGIEADPIRSREHILLSTLLLDAWKKGSSLDLAELIRLIQEPPFSQVGVMSLEAFYPSKERFELAILFNNLLASPGFASWLQGDKLDVGKILYNPEGKPRLAIFSIAHLADAERMFFVSLLLNQILSWMRTQSGTTSLRAILYMDEIYGYFPPVANPPSKSPLLTLLKQARAYGLGILLTTQNPVDLDYKGLSNTGTWFIGRLQTERDKMRVLEGLEGAASTQGAAFDRSETEQILAGLGNRIFLMNNVHDDRPAIFETRWCMSYLRGPLTNMQLRQLKKSEPQQMTEGAQTPVPAGQPALRADGPAGAAPALPPDIRQYFLPVRGSLEELVYQPAAIGFAQVGFRDTASGIQAMQALLAASPITDDVFPVDWEKSIVLSVDINDLGQSGQPGARFAPLPASAASGSSYPVWGKDFASWIYRVRQLDLFKSRQLKMNSEPGESEQGFRNRLQQGCREMRDSEVEKLRQKYAAKINALNEKIRKSEQAVEREKIQANQQKMQTAISVGATILSSFLGRKVLSASSLGRATTAVRGASRVMKEKSDVDRSKETVEAYKAQLKELDESFRIEADDLASKMDPAAMDLDKLILRPAKTDIMVKMLALAWLPYRQAGDGTLAPAWEKVDFIKKGESS
jgi:hypothetical protein